MNLMIDNSKIDDNKNDHLDKEEFGGPKGLEPTRYGKNSPEWEVNGRVSDF